MRLPAGAARRSSPGRGSAPGLKIMVLSASGDEYLAEAIEASANGYILKTTAQWELTRAVVQTASGQGPRDRAARAHQP